MLDTQGSEGACAILAKLADDQLAADPFHRKAEELAALIDMAIEQGSCVQVIGD